MFTNNTLGKRSGVHVVRADLACGEFTGFCIVRVAGTAKGLNVLDSVDFERILPGDLDFDNMELKYDVSDDLWTGMMYSGTGGDKKRASIELHSNQMNDLIVSLSIEKFDED